jgi:type VI secretion system protein ImpK
MNDRVPPRSPFGIPDDRTVIRPNPGGRRAVPQPPSGTPAAPYAPVQHGQAAPQPAAPAGTPYAPPAAPGNANPDAWISSEAPQPQPMAPQSRLPDVRIDELVAPNENPILRSAGPLLLLLGRLRVALARASFASLMEQVAEAIRFFERDIRSAGISEAQANTAKYIICATADDIVQNIPTDDRHIWTQYSMLSRFFGERTGGVRFFDELARLKQDPVVNYDLLELQHTCLALGFHGIHRTTAGGVATLQQIQRDLYETLRRVRPKVYRELSPHWQGQKLASQASRWRVPWWAVLGVVGLVLFGLYFLLLYWLSGDVDPAAARMVALLDSGKLQINRPPPPPPPPVTEQPKPVTPAAPTQLQTICAALGPEVAADKATAEQNANQITVRVGNVLLFDPGSATVLSAFKPVAERIAKTLNDQKGIIKIVGHTDNTPISHSNVRFPSNYHLSVERAKAVAALLRPLIADPDRLQIDGKGETAPVDDNKTAEGRARNRRVEFLIPRTDPGVVTQRTCQR